MNDSGIYTRAQLLAMGYDDGAIRRAVHSGQLVRLRSGWFASPNRHERAMSAVRDGGVLTCVDALDFHGLWIPPGHGDKLHLRRSSNLAGKHPACRPLRGAVRAAHRAVDSVPLALSCAARCLPSDEWIAVCDSYLNSTGRTQGDLLAELDGAGPTVTRLIGLTDQRSQSGTESISRVRLWSEGFDVVVQPQVNGVDRADLRIGILILECDSMLYHSCKEDYERDHHRDRRSLVDGWLCMRLTYDDILYDWEGVLEDIRAVTRADRHRARSRRLKALLQKSVDLSRYEG